jgi:hypothetical protein
MLDRTIRDHIGRQLRAIYGGLPADTRDRGAGRSYATALPARAGSRPDSGEQPAGTVPAAASQSTSNG